MRLSFSGGGQGIALDFLFAILVFLLVLNTSIILIESSGRVASEESVLNEINSSVSQTADMLVRTKGQPDDWEELGIESVTRVGLARRDRVLDNAKLSRFLELGQFYGSSDYNKVKGLLLIGYDYYLRILDSGGSVLYQTGVPSDGRWDGMNAINAKRIVGLNEEEVLLEFTIYYPRR